MHWIRLDKQRPRFDDDILFFIPWNVSDKKSDKGSVLRGKIETKTDHNGYRECFFVGRVGFVTYRFLEEEVSHWMRFPKIEEQPCTN